MQGKKKEDSCKAYQIQKGLVKKKQPDFTKTEPWLLRKNALALVYSQINSNNKCFCTIRRDYYRRKHTCTNPSLSLWVAHGIPISFCSMDVLCSPEPSPVFSKTNSLQFSIAQSCSTTYWVNFCCSSYTGTDCL